MALRIRGFTSRKQRLLDQSCILIAKRLAHLPCPVPRDLCDALRAILSAARPVVDVAYGGDGGGHSTPYARSAGYRVVLYERAFPSKPRGESRLTPVLFHELVHIAHGWELDAEAFENGCFKRSEGARPPTKEDWDIFKAQRYEGWWVQVDSRTRRVTDYADRLVVTFPPKAR